MTIPGTLRAGTGSRFTNQIIDTPPFIDSAEGVGQIQAVKGPCPYVPVKGFFSHVFSYSKSPINMIKSFSERFQSTFHSNP